MAEGNHAQLQLSETGLRQWDLLAAFGRALARRFPPAALPPSWADPRRPCGCADYLSPFLFGRFNPVLKTLQAWSAASPLPRGQRAVSGGYFSLGSFSEAQPLTDPALLEHVFGDLVAAVTGPPPSDVRAAWQQWFARDRSLFAALPRRRWALYGGGRAGGPNNAVRLHRNFHLLADKPGLAQITPGKVCERTAWKAGWEKGAAY